MIDQIKIKGYKSIKELNLQLTPVNIFIGSNGAGKSNFISFFKFLNTLYEQRLENYSLYYGADDVLHFGRRNTKTLEGYISFDNNNAYSFILHPSSDNKLFVHQEFTLFHRSGTYYGVGGWLKELITTDKNEVQIKNHISPIAGHLRKYLQSFRVYHFHDTSEHAPLRATSNVNDNQYLKEDGSNLPSFLYYLQQKHETNYRRIEKTVQSIIPFFEGFKLHPQQLNEQNILLEWSEINHPEKYFNASHLSDGTLRFIALATLLLQPELPKTIIIDEPELGLHPVALNKLAGMIQSASDKRCQIIVSTQSVNLVNNFTPDDIITVDRINNESSYERLNAESLNLWLEDYSVGDLWSKSIIKGQP